MYIKSIRLENFGAFKSLYWAPAKEDLIYIDGINHDESFMEKNGVGKTSLLSAIPFILYGRTLRDGGKKKSLLKDCIRHHSNVTVASIELDDNGETWVIGREVSKTKGSFFIEYKGEVLKGEFAQDFFKRKFDLNYQAFISSCLFGQGMFHAFMGATPEEQVDLLEELFRLKDLEDVRKAIKEDIAAKGELMVAKSKEASILQAEFSTLEARYTLLLALYEKSKNEATKIVQQESSIPKMESNIEDRNYQVKKLQNLLDDVRQQLINTAVAVEGIKSSIPKGYKGLTAGEPCPTCGQIVAEVSEHYAAYKKTVARKTAEIEDLRKQEGQLRVTEAQYVKKVSELNSEYFTLIATKDKLEEEIRKAKEVLLSSDALVNETKDKKDKAEEAWSRSYDTVARLEEEREALNQLYRILGERELRGLIVNKYIDLINHHAAQYVSFLTNGEYEIKFEFVGNKIEASLTNRVNGKQPYFSYSGGERKRIDFGLFMAFNRVNKYIFKTPLNILLIDEGFDALDKRGISMVVELLKKEYKDIGLILCTGHQEGLEDYFDSVLRLEKKNGTTTIG